MKQLTLLFVLSIAFGTAWAQKPVEKSTDKIVFEKKKIVLAQKTVTVEIADNDEKRAYGLMFRASLQKDHGMLFIFKNEERRSFWMKNTLIPLAIGFFDKNKKLVDIQEMVPAVIGEKAPRSYTSRVSAMYALEMEQGWFDKNKIRLGTQFSFSFKK